MHSSGFSPGSWFCFSIFSIVEFAGSSISTVSVSNPARLSPCFEFRPYSASSSSMLLATFSKWQSPSIGSTSCKRASGPNKKVGFSSSSKVRGRWAKFDCAWISFSKRFISLLNLQLVLFYVNRREGAVMFEAMALVGSLWRGFWIYTSIEKVRIC